MQPISKIQSTSGHVALREIVQAASHRDLIANLADKAAGAATKGKYGQVYARAFSLCGGAENKELSQTLNALQAERNKFVHERHRPDAGLDHVYAAHTAIDAAIVGLCEIGISCDIPGRYTCISAAERIPPDSMTPHSQADI